MDLKQIQELLTAQEELLRFEKFDAEDVWKLGEQMAQSLLKSNTPLVVCLRSTTGFVQFQYAPKGTNLNNQNWMERKFNTVCLMEKSSLSVLVESKIKNEGVVEHGLDPKKYVFGGGAFPIRLKTGEMVGVALSSGLPHLQDHNFLIDSLSKYLGVEVPALDASIKL